MQRQVANPLAEQLLSGDVADGSRVEIGVADGDDALAFEVTGAPAAPAAPEEAAAPVAA